MSTLSANTLFHFTKSKENLISILSSNFRPCYCTEKNYFIESEKWQVPMVCFCDIPLSQIEEHTSWYGEYAIGMTKKWAIANNVNPVLYINREVELVNKIKSDLDFLTQLKEKNRIENDGILSTINNLLYRCAYIKPYEGEQYNRKDRQQINKRFYDEREWRYIPIGENESLFSFVTAYFYGQHEALNETVRIYGVDFEPQYINYIIVSKESEILEIKGRVEEIKGDFPPSDVDLLTTRIISMERIKEDF